MGGSKVDEILKASNLDQDLLERIAQSLTTLISKLTHQCKKNLDKLKDILSKSDAC